MRVRCVRTIDETTGAERSSDPWLTIGSEYVVLSLVTKARSRQYYILFSESQGVPALFRVNQCEITDDSLPKSWRANESGEGLVQLGPREWTGSFWDEFNDDKDAARDLFLAVKAQLESES